METALQKRFKQHTIIQLAFHGSQGSLHVGKRKQTDFGTIAELLDGRAADKIIHFGSCSTLNIPARELRRFLKDTGALAISGYTKDVDFIERSVLDILYFRKCQEYRRMPVIETQKKQYYGYAL